MGSLAVFAIGCGDPIDVTVSIEQNAGRTREYFIAADEVAWDYAPTGINQITGEPFDEQANVFVEQGPDRIGKVYVKALYREYTDGRFRRLKARPPRWEHLGFLGPVVRAVVGDTIVFHFKNNTTRPLSVHPHGVFYAKNAEGAPYNDGTSGGDKADDAVPPGRTFDYVWQVPERAGPGPMDGSSIGWMYHSHTDEVVDTYSGLVGPLLVTARGMDRSPDDPRPRDVDRELYTMFDVDDENQSAYLQQNIDTYAGDPGSVDPEDDDFIESNLMHNINGYVYGNLPGLTMNLGSHVRWYLMAMGTEVDLHTPHWHGHTVTIMGMRTDVANLLPATMQTADMVPDDPGTWLYHCHVNDHILAGMLALYRAGNNIAPPAGP
jgi:hephaestin